MTLTFNKLTPHNLYIFFFCRLKMGYYHINESIEAIVQSLSIQSTDRVLSICSCAQPFGFLEFVSHGSVLAIDRSKIQITIAKDILKEMKCENAPAIASMHLTPKDGEYFSDEERLERIAGNARNIRFKVHDVEEETDFNGETFTKGYFSNTPVDLIKYHPVFEKGALVYVTYASPHLPEDISIFKRQSELDWKCVLDNFYTIDVERTRVACKIEESRKYRVSVSNEIDFFWTPCVFIRQ